MKVLSLYDGISCGMVALERAGIKVERYVAYEIDKYAIQISERNYPNIEHKGNALDVSFEEYKGFDLLIGGRPCTYWSVAKHNRETTPDGMGGKLFMAYVKALRESGCKWFLYENNYSIHQNIKDFISEQLGVRPVMINSALVSAQQRKRCYWTNIPNVTQPEDKGILLEDILETKGSKQPKALNESVDKPVRLGHIGKSTGQANRVYSVHGKSVCLQSQAGGSGAKTGLYKVDLPDGDYVIRKLTPLEAERLQTLPDGYTDKGVSDSQRYKCIGNGWTVDVIAHILRGLKEA